MSRIFLIACSLFIAACTPKEQMLRTDVVAEPQQVGRIYITALNKVGTDPYKLGVGTNIISIEHEGDTITPKSGIVQLPEGEYKLKVEWWRITKDTSMFVPTLGSMMLIIDGNMLKANGTYNISFQAKAGKTYVIDVANTVRHYNTVPDKLCLTEEEHEAKGVTYPAIGKGFRYPSKAAAIPGCAALSINDGEHNKSINKEI